MTHNPQEPMIGTRIGIESDQRQRVTIEPADIDGWSMVLHRFIREHMRHLSAAPIKIQLHMFDVRDRRTGRSMTDRKRIAAATGLSPSSITEGVQALERSQPILLAVHSPTEFEVYPGVSFAGAKAPPVRTGECPVRPAERGFAVPNENGVTHRETRARSQTEEERDRSRTEPPSAPQGALAGWQGRGLCGAVSAREVLIEIGLREPLLTATADLPGLTGEEVARVAAAVRLDKSIGNPAVITADRLFEARKRTRPVLGRRAMLSAQQQRAVAALERIRQGGGA